MMSFSQAIKQTYWKKLFVSKGRASRSEFWWTLFYWALVNTIFAITLFSGYLGVFDRYFENDFLFFILFFVGIVFVFNLWSIFALSMVLIRRFHDINIRTAISVFGFIWPILIFGGLTVYDNFDFYFFNFFLVPFVVACILALRQSYMGVNEYGDIPNNVKESLYTQVQNQPRAPAYNYPSQSNIASEQKSSAKPNNRANLNQSYGFTQGAQGFSQNMPNNPNILVDASFFKGNQFFNKDDHS